MDEMVFEMLVAGLCFFLHSLVISLAVVFSCSLASQDDLHQGRIKLPGSKLKFEFEWQENEFTELQFKENQLR